MRILIISQWYPPDAMKLLSDFAETLMDLGHEVEFMAGLPNWPGGKLYPGYKSCLWMRENQKGVRVTRFFVFPDHSRSAVRRALNFLSYAVSATLLGPFLMPRCDLVYFVHPPATAALPAVLLSRLWHIPMMMEIQDMWPETLDGTGMVRSRVVLSGIGLFCSWVYRRAVAIRVISEGFKRNLVRKGVPEGKIHVISNWVDTDFYRPLEPDAELAKEFGCAGKFTAMFAGTVGLAQGLDVILDAAVLLRGDSNVQFLIVGNGADSDRLQEMARARRLNNVRFVGRYPSEAMARIFSLADVLLVHLRDHPLFRITVPHKLFTYLAAGKPVLAAVEGDARAVVERARAGLYCAPGSPQALAETVQKFHAMSREALAQMGRDGRSTALEQYNRLGLVRQIARLMEKAVISTASGPAVFFYKGTADEIPTAEVRLPPGFTWELWRPSLAQPIPRGAPVGVFAVWFLFHLLHVFRNRGYAVLLIRDCRRLVHRSLVTPRYFRFPFMRRSDLQIGDTWTDPAYRGRGLAVFAIQRILSHPEHFGGTYWYIVEPQNAASIRAAEKGGLQRVGSGVRVRRFGLRALGAFRIIAQQQAAL